MSKRTAWGAVAAGLAILLGVAALALTPIDRAGYRKAAAETSTNALSSVRTVALVVRADLAGKVTRPYAVTVVDVARAAVASATRDLAAREVPDGASRDLRDRLLPLLATAAAAVADTGLALDTGGRGELVQVAAGLDTVGDQLDQLVRSLR